MTPRLAILAYAAMNLGDDLFLDNLFKRYPYAQFILDCPKQYVQMFPQINIQRVPVPSNELLRRIFFKCVKITNFPFDRFAFRTADVAVTIGGSMYIDPNLPDMALPKQMPMFIIGSNYGPEHSLDYRQVLHSYFQSCADVCFRDEYSKNLFSNLHNVRSAPDVIFSADYSMYAKQNTNNSFDGPLVVSVIDVSWRRSLAQYQKDYFSFIKHECEKTVSNGQEVILISFCKHEGDEKACEELFSMLDTATAAHTQIHRYRGNLTETLSIIGSAWRIIGSRFHSIVLGLAMGKQVLPLSYSNKTVSMLHDLGLGDGISIASLRNTELIDDYVSLNSKQIRLLREKAQQQFKALDAYMMRTTKQYGEI